VTVGLATGRASVL